jgi:enoyl-CoA hydratase/carnithine racemase
VNEKRTGVVWLKLNRPSKLNALTEEVGTQFQKAIAQLNEMEDIRSVILTGEGHAFSAGGDIDFLLDRRNHSIEENTKTMKHFYSRYLTLRDLKVPTIAAINGPAVGAGLCVAMACDIRVASKSAKMSVNFVKLGIHPGLAATYFLPKVAGSQVAAYMLMTGAMITGEKAQELGIVLEACEKEDVADRALAIARSIAESSPVAVKAVTSTLRAQADDLEAAIDREAFVQSQTYAEDDMIEGLQAVREKRKANFERKE